MVVSLRRIPGRAYLILAVIIFAAANAITRKLSDLGAQNAVAGRNPISFCNVLFVGNLVALIALVTLYGRELSPHTWRHLSWRDWGVVSLIALLSGALAPALFFMALEQTSVNTVVLLGRIEPPLTLALSVWFLRERVNGWVVVGALLAFVGVVLTIVLAPSSQQEMSMGMLSIGRGELMALGGAIAAAVATVISKAGLVQLPLGLFNIARTAIGTVIFLVAVVLLFQPSHFMDVFHPFLWRWMLLYGVIIVVGGQLAWTQGLRHSQAAEVSLASSFSPIAGVLAAYVVLGEVPTAAQYIGGVVILLGIALNHWGVSHAPAKAVSTVLAREMDHEIGFRGI
ncbi:DMT family transporter [Halomicronema hongdechloris]|uniref:DMT family transporter n=1 Tax=Halomicronema hongdechloris TaxID=1209493 RepID=UPI0009B99F3B